MTKEERQKIINDIWHEAQKTTDPLAKELNELFNAHNNQMEKDGLKYGSFKWRIKNILFANKIFKERKIPLRYMPIFEVTFYDTIKAHISMFIAKFLIILNN